MRLCTALHHSLGVSPGAMCMMLSRTGAEQPGKPCAGWGVRGQEGGGFPEQSEPASTPRAPAAARDRLASPTSLDLSRVLHHPCPLQANIWNALVHLRWQQLLVSREPSPTLQLLAGRFIFCVCGGFMLSQFLLIAVTAKP